MKDENACYNRAMRTPSGRHSSPLSWLQLVWGGLAVVVWGGVQVWRARHGYPFSPVVFLKGVTLLLLAAAVFHWGVKRRPSFLYLGSFPLLWLAVSQFQWDICVIPEERFWSWLVLFLLGELVLLIVADGQRLLALMVPLWMAMSYLFPFSFFLPLCGSTGKEGRLFRRAGWMKWGGLLAGIAIGAVLQAWKPFRPYGYEVLDLMVANLFISFFLLGWLGFIAFSPPRGGVRPAIIPFFLLPLGFVLFAAPDPVTYFKFDLLKWVLVFCGGFGWESFRRDVMDRSWHGQLVWFALGVAFFGGVLI